MSSLFTNSPPAYKPVAPYVQTPKLEKVDEKGFWFYFWMVLLVLLVIALMSFIFGNSSTRSMNRNAGPILSDYKNLEGKTFMQTDLKDMLTDPINPTNFAKIAKVDGKMIYVMTNDMQLPPFAIVSSNDNMLRANNKTGVLTIADVPNRNKLIMTINDEMGVRYYIHSY